MTTQQLVITTPLNPVYSGETFGVKFHEGRAVVNEHTRNRFKYTVEELRRKFEEYNSATPEDEQGNKAVVYELEVIEGDEILAPIAEPAGDGQPHRPAKLPKKRKPGKAKMPAHISP